MITSYTTHFLGEEFTSELNLSIKKLRNRHAPSRMSKWDQVVASASLPRRWNYVQRASGIFTKVTCTRVFWRHYMADPGIGRHRLSLKEMRRDGLEM